MDGAQGAGVELRELKDLAEQYLGRRQYLEAEMLFRVVVRQAPDDARLRVRHAEVLRRLGDRRGAARAYAAAAVRWAEDGHTARANAARTIAESLDLALRVTLPPPKRIRTAARSERPIEVAGWTETSEASDPCDFEIDVVDPEARRLEARRGARAEGPVVGL